MYIEVCLDFVFCVGYSFAKRCCALLQIDQDVKGNTILSGRNGIVRLQTTLAMFKVMPSEKKKKGDMMLFDHRPLQPHNHES